MPPASSAPGDAAAPAEEAPEGSPDAREAPEAPGSGPGCADGQGDGAVAGAAAAEAPEGGPVAAVAASEGGSVETPPFLAQLLKHHMFQMFRQQHQPGSSIACPNYEATAWEWMTC